MTTLTTNTEHLADLELYKTQKPYFIFWSPEDVGPRPIPTTNMELETHEGTIIHDVRGREADFSIERHSFEIHAHQSDVSLPLDSELSVNNYRHETEELHKQRFDAEFVYCFETRIRKNDEATRKQVYLDLRDPLSLEKPAAGLHIDATINSGPMIIRDRLPEEFHHLLTPDKRVRLVNTWRPMLPVVEDKPLTFLDYFSIDKDDLIAVDRVTPFQAGEVYMVKYSANQRWYWLSKMKSSELLVMLTYDTTPGDGAKFAAHCAVDDPNARPDAPSRLSIETRSIVISK